MRKNAPKFYVLLLALCSVLAACSSEQSQPTYNDLNSSSNSSSSNDGGAFNQEPLIVRNEKGVEVAKLTEREIEFNGQVIRYKYGSSGKRKYVNEAGQIVAKIKRSGPEKFKLKSESGVLLWKVKRKSDSIKIADNEEMQQAYKIKQKGKERAKVLLNEQPYFEVKLSDGQGSLSVDGSDYQVSGNDVVSVAVISLEDISMLHRLIIIKELSE